MKGQPGRTRKPVKRAQSAGGVVFRRDGGAPRILLLKHSSGKWMLPKGTIEEGETPEAVALREVREETGIANVRVVADLGEERYYFFWRSEGTYYDKTVRYFLLEFLGGEEARPPAAGGVRTCGWVSLHHAIQGVK